MTRCRYCEDYEHSRACCALGTTHIWRVYLEMDSDGDVMHRCVHCGCCTYELKDDLETRDHGIEQ